MQDVKDSIEVLGLLYGGDVGGLFDDANQTLITGRARAIDAGIDVGDVIANGAETEIGFNVAHRYGKGFGVVIA